MATKRRCGVGGLRAQSVGTAAVAPCTRAVPAPAPSGPRINAAVVPFGSVPPPAARGAALPRIGVPPSPSPRARTFLPGVLRGIVLAAPSLPAYLGAPISHLGAARRSRLRRARSVGSLALAPLSSASPRPRPQVGDAASVPRWSPVAVVVVVVVVPATHRAPAGPWTGSSNPPKCSKALVVFLAQLHPLTDACHSENLGSTCGATIEVTTLPESVQKHVGSWRGRCTSGLSAPAFFRIHSNKSTLGPNILSRTAGS